MGIDELKVELQSIISDLVKDEWEAVDGYNGAITAFQFLEDCDCSDIVLVLKDIVAEEYVHIGLLLKLLQVKTGEGTDIDKGAEEAEELLEDGDFVKQAIEDEDEEDDEEDEEEFAAFVGDSEGDNK